MSVYFFTAFFNFLLFLFMCDIFSEKVCANTSPTQSASVNGFDVFTEKGKIKDVLKPDGQNKNKANEITVNEFYSPFLMATKDVMIALAGANYTEDTKKEKNIGILTRYIKIEDGWGGNAVKSPYTDWKTQLAVHNEEEKKGDETFILKSLLALEKKNKVYVLLVNCTKTTGSEASSSLTWTFKVVVGNVNIKKLEETIVWGGSALPVADVNDLTNKFKDTFSGGG